MFSAFRDLPIRHKMMRISMLVSTSALLLACLGFIVYELFTFRETMVQSLASQAEIIGINTVSALLFNDPKAASETMTALRVRSRVVSAAIYTAGGQLFARYVRDDGVSVFQMPERITEKEASHRFQGGSLFVSQPIISEGQKIGTVYIQSDLNEMEDRLKRYAAIVVGVLAISLLAAHRISSRLQGRISEPILHLARTARTVSEEKNYSVRAAAESRDEVGLLVDTFNEMLDQIQVREDALQKAHNQLEQKVAERTRELQQEIVERVRAEEKFRTVAETANDAIVTADRDGKIIYFNKGAERTFGYPASEAVGRSLTLLMPERFHDAHQKGFKHFLSTGEARVVGKTVELVGRGKNGGEFPVELSLACWKTGGEIFFTGILRDITERKLAEEARNRLNAQLEAANKELEAFSYSVSHDLRAPLRHIDGFSQILLEDYDGKLDDGGRHYLQQVRQASQQMAQLIDDMLNLSRVTRAEMRRETVDLSRMAEAAAEALRKMQPDRAVEFVIEKGLTAEGDERLLQVALDNLLGNAWKYTGKCLQARIEFGRTNHDSRTAYFVRDNGAGFDMAYAHKLFGAFQRLHAASEFPGTGVGLATVQRILHRHGGQVWADGAVGQGATFYFTL